MKDQGTGPRARPDTRWCGCSALSFTAQSFHHVSPAAAPASVAGSLFLRRTRRVQGRYRAASGGGLRPAL